MDYICKTCSVRQKGTPGMICSDCGKPMVPDSLSENNGSRMKELILGKKE